MQEILHKIGRIKYVYRQQLYLKESFLDFAARFATYPETIVLLSGGNQDSARYNILAALPWLGLRGRHNRLKLTLDNECYQIKTDPFDALRYLLDFYQISNLWSDMPVISGLFGYLSYDLKDRIEDIPRTSVDDLKLPHILLYAPSILVIQDIYNNNTCLCIPVHENKGGTSLKQNLKIFEEICSSPLKPFQNFFGDPCSFDSNFQKSTYLKSIEKIKSYIRSGDVYQVNLSQRFHMEFSGDGFSLFKKLFYSNPAPFYAYVNAGDHQIVSTSPERFLQRIGKHVETRPIKGTRPRGKSRDEDEYMVKELLGSCKDEAELSMIVDLLRNDLGKVCEGGSVQVQEHKRLEKYQNVYHMVSIITGTLRQEIDSVDLLKATFPGGSITGCPKVRSMEIIDELEPHRRHIYTGSLGYFSFHDTLDLSIAIRTATLYNEKIVYSVGGGIVYDSDAELEFEETLHKGQTLMQALKGLNIADIPENSVWQNGVIISEKDSKISTADLCCQYGFGFFETIRVNKGHPCFLPEHISRFNQTWDTLFNSEPPDLDWKTIIEQVIQENGLEEEASVVKILAGKGQRDEPPFDNLLLVTAKPYLHRLKHKQKPGLALKTYPYPRQTPLADYKTLNYLYYHLAGKWAVQNKADEALILNPDGSVSETNSANILLIQGKEVYNPCSEHVLSGVMLNKVLELLETWGYCMVSRKCYPQDLYLADQVLITNSLLGAATVLSLDGKALYSLAEISEKINKILINEYI